MKRVQLAEGYTISQVIKGCWQMSKGHSSGHKNTEAAIADLCAFAEAGITTFDCADIYTGVEELLGMFHKEYANRHGRAALDAIQVHTKFVPDLDKLSHINRDYVEAIINRSLRRLGMETLDLVQFHWWDFGIPGFVETAGILADLQREGKIRNLGVTNFDVVNLDEVVKSGVKIVSNQIQYSLVDRRAELAMRGYCKNANIKLLCYGVLAGGFISEHYLGAAESTEPFTNRSLVKYKIIIDDFGGWKVFQELLRALDSIAQHSHLDIGTLAAAITLNNKGVADAIILGGGAKRLGSIVRIPEIMLSPPGFMCRHAYQKVLEKAKGPLGDIYQLERIKGGKHAAIMRYNLNERK